MRFEGLREKLTGVLVPVFSLRSQESVGSGEFLDLPLLGQWCKNCGVNLIQILPVNDTGDDPSPYSALSAFALHPIYIRVQALPEFSQLAKREEITKKIASIRVSQQKLDRLQYREVLYGKLEILRDIYRDCEPEIEADNGLKAWIKANPWVRDYAVFRALKDREQLRSWVEWQSYREITEADILKLWKSKDLPTLFFAWLQYRLEEQFLQASRELKGLGVLLKGDIPILMNEDSVDVWAHREIFHFDLRAGSPPDSYSPEGQNWGFPIYNWDALETRNFDWWQERLLQADKFYQAYRIDHVLGFFRIWAIDRSHTSGSLGYFKPASFIHRAELYRRGLDDGRIRWLSEPHVQGAQLRGRFGAGAQKIIEMAMEQIGNEDLYLFRSDIRGERDIYVLGLESSDTETLLKWFRDRALIQIEEHLFAPAWNYRSSGRYQGLAEQEKAKIEELLREKAQENEKIWEQMGRKLLSFMKSSVDMLACAEDLGAIPASVPTVLTELEILGLKIPRWTRHWDLQGQPFIPLANYPWLSVCAPSVHDTSTLRQWWEEEDGREDFWHSLGLPGPCPSVYGPETAAKVLAKLQEAGSAICVYQVQDFFAGVPGLRARQSQDERTNIPGTVQDRNWSYRIPVNLEKLLQDGDLRNLVSSLTKTRPKPGVQNA